MVIEVCSSSRGELTPQNLFPSDPSWTVFEVPLAWRQMGSIEWWIGVDRRTSSEFLLYTVRGGVVHGPLDGAGIVLPEETEVKRSGLVRSVQRHGYGGIHFSLSGVCWSLMADSLKKRRFICVKKTALLAVKRTLLSLRCKQLIETF